MNCKKDHVWFFLELFTDFYFIFIKVVCIFYSFITVDLCCEIYKIKFQLSIIRLFIFLFNFIYAL